MSLVMNGVEFRTGHNDYRLMQPSLYSTEFRVAKIIDMPNVPPEVLSQPTIQDQIAEMREWFRAWKSQDESLRRYKRYFKPVLCYLEGYWINEDEDEFEHGFLSGNKAQWPDILVKCMYKTYVGRENESLPCVPTKLVDITDDGIPVLAQWSYRVMCHPLQADLPLDQFNVVDDLAVRVSQSYYSKDQLEQSKSARFTLNNSVIDPEHSDRTLLDSLMEQIPGLDNYPGSLVDNTFDEIALEAHRDGLFPRPLNAAYYHRQFNVVGKNGEGTEKRKRAYSDIDLFSAFTTQSIVARVAAQLKSAKSCADQDDTSAPPCQKPKNKTLGVTWAIPLEVIYITPLSKWNPFGINYYNDDESDEAKAVTANGRDGTLPSANAYNGTRGDLFFRTPEEFFSDNEFDPVMDDTTPNSVAVLDSLGQMRITRASGHRIFFPDIPGLGIIRQRYPIFPVYSDDTPESKEIAAIKELLLNKDKLDLFMN